MNRILEKLIDPKVLGLTLCFLSNPHKLYHLQMLAKHSKIPIATVYRILPKLISADIVQIRKVGKLKLYQLNETRQTLALHKLLK